MTNDDINRAVSAILRNSLLPSSATMVEKWRLLARNIAGVESVAEGLDFIYYAITAAESEGRELKWPEDYRSYAFKWNKALGPKWRKKHEQSQTNNATPQPAPGPDPGR